MKIKNIILSIVSIILLISLTSAFGVSSPYWDENPLVMDRGETKTVNLNLQNMIGEEDVEVKAFLIEGNDVTSLSEDTFLVKSGTSNTTVPLKISVSKDAIPGETKTVKVELKTVQEDTQGISMGTGMTIAFDVIAGEAVAETSTGMIVALIIAILILVAMLWILLKNKKKR
ncbi:MAG TPA: hypothetical protein VJ438_00890 [Candidatus Nanoarchaeia archaeon]|nr:hypothetical protein [Candidatus Nanoarchaeia archaeon]